MRFIALALIGGAVAGSVPAISSDMAMFNSGDVSGSYTNAPENSMVRVRQQGSAYVQHTEYVSASAGNWSGSVEYGGRVNFIAELINEFGNETLATSTAFSTNATQFTVTLAVTACLDGFDVKYSYTATVSPAASVSGDDWIATVPKTANGDLSTNDYDDYNYVEGSSTVSTNYLTLSADDTTSYALVYMPEDEYIFVKAVDLAIPTTVTTACPTSSSSSSTISSSSSSTTVASSSSSASASSSASTSASASTDSTSATGSTSDSETSDSGSGSGSSSAGVVSAVFSLGLMAAALLF